MSDARDAPSVDARAVQAAGHRPTTIVRVAWEVFGGALHHGTRQVATPVCETCGRPWRGSRETGGCDAVLLARRVVELEGALQHIIEHGHVLCCVHEAPCASSGNAIGIAEHALRAPASSEGE